MNSLLPKVRRAHMLGNQLRGHISNSLHDKFLSVAFLGYFPKSYLFHTSGLHVARPSNKKAERTEKSREASGKLLEKLRKTRLEGLVNPEPVSTPEEKLTKRIRKIQSIKGLLQFYWFRVNKKRELTPLHKFTILECIVVYFSKSVQMRDVFLTQPLQQSLFEMLAQDVRVHLNDFDANQIYNVVIYMAKLCVKDPSIYADLERGILYHKLRGYSNKQLSQLGWAFAKYCLHTNVVEIFHALDKEIFSRDISKFSSEELCTIAWSFSEFGFPKDRQFYKAIGSEILTRDLSQFKPWTLASLSLSYSRADAFVAEVFEVVEEELLQRDDLKSFATNDLVILVLAFGRVGKLHPELFQKFEVTMVKRRDYAETVVREYLQETYHLLKKSEFHLAVVVKMIERVLDPDVCNSLFDILFRPRRSWKEKILHQYLFKAY